MNFTISLLPEFYLMRGMENAGRKIQNFTNDKQFITERWRGRRDAITKTRVAFFKFKLTIMKYISTSYYFSSRHTCVSQKRCKVILRAQEDGLNRLNPTQPQVPQCIQKPTLWGVESKVS